MEKGQLLNGLETLINGLYDERTHLMAMVCVKDPCAWKSRLHSDGTSMPGYFIVGYNTIAKQITYHCEDKYWDLFNSVTELDKAIPWDGHVSSDVLSRIRKHIKFIENEDDDIGQDK